MWPSQTNYCCWHCCHPFSNVPAFLPQLTKTNTFELSGNFCSWNCVKAYAHHLNPAKPRGTEFIAIFAFLTVHRPKYCDVPASRSHAPGCGCLALYKPLLYPLPHTALSAFGGSASIDEYRRGFCMIASIDDVNEIFKYGKNNVVYTAITKPYLYIIPTRDTVIPNKPNKEKKAKTYKLTQQDEGEESDGAPVVHVKEPRCGKNIIQSLKTYTSVTG